MADVSERMIWKGGLWIGIFVNRDYCRFTSDCSHRYIQARTNKQPDEIAKRRLERPVGYGTFGIHERRSVEAG